MSDSTRFLLILTSLLGAAAITFAVTARHAPTGRQT